MAAMAAEGTNVRNSRYGAIVCDTCDAIIPDGDVFHYRHGLYDCETCYAWSRQHVETAEDRFAADVRVFHNVALLAAVGVCLFVALFSVTAMAFVAVVLALAWRFFGSALVDRFA